MNNVATIKPVIVKVGDRVRIAAKGIILEGIVTDASNPMVNRDGVLFAGYNANDYIVGIVTDRGDYRNWHGVSDGGTIAVI
jgi:hypothetical protein